MIRVAIVGTGNISSAHIHSYLAFPERCEIAALVDIPEKAREKAAAFGLNAEILDSHKLLLGRDDIDLVSICTPPFLHAEIASDLLRDGKHVLVEKPMAASLEECDRMIAAAEEGGAILSVVAQNRFREPIMNLKHVLDSGKIGRVVHAQVDSYWWRGHCYYDLWWRGLWSKEGGGPTLNHAVHHIDMLGWMMGMPDKVVAMLSNAAHDNAEVEDISVAVMQYGQGSVAQVTSSVIHHGEEQQIIFQGEKARISAPWKVYASTSKENGFPQRNEKLEEELEQYYGSLPQLAHTGHQGQIHDVLSAIESGTAPMITGEDGRKTIELITAIYKAGFQEKAVDLPIQQDDPYYTVQGILDNAPHFYEKKTALKELGSGVGITLGSSYNQS
ncbi:Gfo/Idh/MocA family protein [Paenibacillus protaetiae]|uniref:Gfo/Idh/MocA family oxidoreductase n=1 Tax=Paenibacillus protaetiae TaxID=2509456 RepID=A0A4P6F0I6_9BACL|nr:Gfo/Idh/MocA family oxidoreductase [Paenibacillus protaetiae]QAY66507.1 Gfo/Idh/MocA family oxidoreductase [Paenibacillus protaetiae]